ncbi:H+-transporting ATPase [Xanthobacter flavus]|uniref:H+-transporting ATPase n=1 Tax=Xanthobacter flavus TaxID=281 RepID=A0A9W6CTD7_XANFL|nr:plasma-membrane proton-efflux P-type ATPase [Xanthobacter flavus]MDR6336245.1 H+-transporting ATPase [Xanthobacter flavus]GLI25014.1 plasma-membrane proton-efflux P-type ATPase [Xanthobacter flavus]
MAQSAARIAAPAPAEAPAAKPAASSGGPVRLDAAAISAKFTELGSSPKGLTATEAAERQAKYGPNAIVAHEDSRWEKLVGYFWGPIPWMIEAAALLSLIRQDWPDFIVVMGLLIYNAIVGFWQDSKAASALAALKKGLALKARVLRDNKWMTVDTAALVPGDVVSVAGGETLPADVLLVEGKYLSVDQAALTGESLPVSKGVGDSGYSGSIVRQGTMTGLVTATGNATFFGRTAKLVASAGAKSHAEKAVIQMGDFLIILSAALALVLVVAQVHRDIIADGHWEWQHAGAIVQIVLVLLVASVPVATPAVMSVTMALGALALSKQQAIVSRLSAIEELAGVDVLCSDKTGTLTLNQLTLQTPIPWGKAAPDDLILGAALASQRQSDDAIDKAVIAAVTDPKVLDGYKSVDFTPFDPVSKKTVASVAGPDGKTVHFAKGAPQAIAAQCGLSEADAKGYFDAVEKLARSGTRALGVARSDDGKTWTLLGLLPMLDPPRPDAAETIAKAKALGVSVKMVTGDDVAIGGEISRQLGLGDHLLVASDVFGQDSGPEHIAIDAARAVEVADGFGRVFPEHKFQIVKALQERGHIVAMTGDGVNDAPALKQADCGVAVSGATDAARSAAALILTAPGLSTIINAIMEARAIFERITSYIYYRIAMTLNIMLVVVLVYLVYDFMPLTAIMIVVMALLDDIPIMTIAYDNVKVQDSPVRWNMQRILSFSTIMGIMALVQSFGIVMLGMFWMKSPELMARLPMDLSHIQTMLFLQLCAGGHLLFFVSRVQGTLFRPPYPSLPVLAAVMGTQVFAIFMCAFGWFMPALPWLLIGVVWAYCLVWTLVMDLVKVIYFRFVNARERRQSMIDASIGPVVPG